MTRSIRARLYDINENIAFVLDVSHRRTLTHFQNDTPLRCAILHALMIIADAAHHLPLSMTARYPTIPWSDMIALGTMIPHDDRRMDTETIWNVVTVHLKPLQQVIKTVLADLDAP